MHPSIGHDAFMNSQHKLWIMAIILIYKVPFEFNISSSLLFVMPFICTLQLKNWTLPTFDYNYI
jgi:hypothetical protein